MNNKLKSKAQEWMSLERKTIAQRKEADDFYEKELMELITEEFIRSNKTKVVEKVDYLVVSAACALAGAMIDIQMRM